MNYKSQRLAVLQNSKQQAIYCNVTGIFSFISNPAIQGRVIESASPYAQLMEAKSIALLSDKELHNIHPEILSGCILAILSHYKLNKETEQEFSAAMKNELLSSLGKNQLIRSLRFYASLGKKTLEKYDLPSLSFSSVCYYQESKYSGMKEILNAHVTSCISIINPVKSPDYEHNTSKTVAVRKSSFTGRTVKPSIQKIDKDKAKKNISILSRNNLISNKFYNILSYCFTGDNLYTLEQEQREKIYKKLIEINSFEATELAIFFKSKAFINKDFNPVNEVSTTAQTTRKMTLKELLEYKITGKLPEKTKEIEKAEGPVELDSSSNQEQATNEDNNNEEQAGEEDSLNEETRTAAANYLLNVFEEAVQEIKEETSILIEDEDQENDNDF